MAARQIVPGVYEVSLGFVNAFLIDADGLTLIDTGVAGSTEKILGAVRALGRQPQDIRHILVTHCHADHSGSLAELKAATGAPAYMHPVDAEMVRAGRATRPMRPGPGIFNHLLFRLFMARRRAAPTTIQPTSIEREVQDGEELPIAGGIRAIHTPGHTPDISASTGRTRVGCSSSAMQPRTCSGSAMRRSMKISAKGSKVSQELPAGTSPWRVSDTGRRWSEEQPHASGASGPWQFAQRSRHKSGPDPTGQRHG